MLPCEWIIKDFFLLFSKLYYSNKPFQATTNPQGDEDKQTVTDLSNNDDQQLSETGKANIKYMSTNSKVRTPNEWIKFTNYEGAT